MTVFWDGSCGDVWNWIGSSSSVWIAAQKGDGLCQRKKYSGRGWPPKRLRRGKQQALYILEAQGLAVSQFQRRDL